MACRAIRHFESTPRSPASHCPSPGDFCNELRHPLPTVESTLHESILVLTLDNPPVNALGVEVRRGLLAALDSAADNPAVEGILILGAGRHFCGGADIREFGKPPQPPALPELVKRIEACAKPVVAAIHGVALGGGLEVALAAHYRLAVRGARLGLPEVQLGLLPGAGGTQRLPRLIGAKAALELMLSGRHLSAEQALELGLVDRLGDSDDAQAEGLAYLGQLLANQAGARRTRDALALSDLAPSGPPLRPPASRPARNPAACCLRTTSSRPSRPPSTGRSRTA